MLLSCIYIKPGDDIKKLFNGKTKLSVRKLLKSFGQGSRLIMLAVELICKKSGNQLGLHRVSSKKLYMFLKVYFLTQYDRNITKF